jgi:putative restriction endonuclease
VQPIWDEFIDNREDLFYESEKLRAQFEKKPIEQLIDFGDIDLLEGKEKERLVRMRVNQYMFRSMVLASYDFTCCVTGIKNPGLVLASHISPWSSDKKNRLNPKNGLCLNALHDRAFDKYLFTVTPSYKIRLSKRLLSESQNEFVQTNFLKFEGKAIAMPQRYEPDEKFLKLHNKAFVDLNS